MTANIFSQQYLQRNKNSQCMCRYHSLYKHWVYKQNTCDNIDFKARLIFYSPKMNDAVKERQTYVRHVEKNE